MSREELEVLKEIQDSRGWKMLEYILNQKIKQLDSVREIDGRSETKAGIEALARKKAVLLLEEFLNELGLTQSLKSSNQTYE